MAALESCYSDDALPVFTATCEKPNDNAISDLFLTDQLNPIAGDASTLAAWTARLSNTSDGTGGTGNPAHPIRRIPITDGEKQPVTGNYKSNKSGTVQLIQKSDHSVTWVDDDDSDEKYNFYRQFQKGGAVLLYYRSEPHIYGAKAGVGNAPGIKATLKCSYGIVPGSDMAHRWTCSLDWKAEEDPDRVLSPF